MGKTVLKQEVEYPKWDAEKFLAEKKKDKSYNHSAPRIWVFKHNLEVFQAGGYVSQSGREVVFEENPVSVIYDKEFNVNDVPAGKEETITGVRNIDCIDWTLELEGQGYHPALLNLSGQDRPCGKVKTGAGAQEESICQRTDLCQALYPYFKEADAKLVNTTFINNVYPLEQHFGCIYSPSIRVFRSSPEKGFALLDDPQRISIITIGAVNKRKSSDFALSEEEIGITGDRIRTIYRTGLANGHDSLVLGAFGCGVFKTPPIQIAELFKKISLEPEFHNKYKALFFAILQRGNRKSTGKKFKPFYDIFGQFKASV